MLSELQAESKTGYLLISHDLGVVRYLADRIAVMYLGRIMEAGESEAVFRGPNHPYTEALLSAVPNVDGEDRGAHPARGRDPQRGHPPRRLRLQHALPPGLSGGLCEVVEPPLVRGRTRPHDESPHPARGTSTAPAALDGRRCAGLDDAGRRGGLRRGRSRGRGRRGNGQRVRADRARVDAARIRAASLDICFIRRSGTGVPVGQMVWPVAAKHLLTWRLPRVSSWR